MTHKCDWPHSAHPFMGQASMTVYWLGAKNYSSVRYAYV